MPLGYYFDDVEEGLAIFNEGLWVLADVGEEDVDECAGAVLYEVDDELWVGWLYEGVEKLLSCLFGLDRVGFTFRSRELQAWWAYCYQVSSGKLQKFVIIIINLK